MSLSAFLVALLLPPTSLVWLALLALLVPRRAFRWLATALLAAAVLLSTPMVAQSLLASLDPGIQPSGPVPDAIVILSADVERTMVPGVLDVGALTLERERAGAALHWQTGLPVLVTGGLVNGPPPVAVLMARSLPADFGVPVRWAETRSATTWENAQFSAPILREAGVKRVYLVTHGWHMRRSLLAFARAGIDAVPAPIRDDPWPLYALSELIPGMAAWHRSYYAIHEWVGLIYYMVRKG